MKKRLSLLLSILMLATSLSFVSCKNDEETEDMNPETENSNFQTESETDASEIESKAPETDDDTSGTKDENSETNDDDISISEYELIYESNGDGTCDVIGLNVSLNSKNAVITVPAVSPDGERVISCDIACNPLPTIIEKDVFDDEICAKLLIAIENGALYGVDDGKTAKDNFYYRKFKSFFTLCDINDPENSQEDIDKMQSEYPITKEKAVYVFCDNASSREVREVTSYIFEYTDFFESESYYESALLSKDYKFHDSFCMAGAVKKIIFEEGIETIQSMGNHSKVTDVTIPNSVTTIVDEAFEGCSNLIQVENGVSYVDKWAVKCNDTVADISLRSNIVGIAERAFTNCDNVRSIVIPNCVTTIGGSAFRGCSGLTNIEIPNSVTTIGDSAFSGCSGLASIEIPNSVTTIGDSAFSRCSGLASIEISNSVTTIGDSAFSNCSSLTGIVIPNSVTSINGSVFSGCNSLASLTVENGNPKYHSNGNCIIETAEKMLVAGCKSSSIPSDGSVTAISILAFEGCSGLTSIEIPNSITSIENFAFKGCNGITSIEIPNSVTTIGGYAFWDCRSLTSIEIPSSVISIGSSAFRDCSNLETIIYHGTEEEWDAITSGQFEYLSGNITFLG